MGDDEWLDQCEVHDCENIPMYAGWWRVVDGFGIPTGYIQRRQVCEMHKDVLIDNQKSGVTNEPA